jgi:tetratricopeptide (TPR) repeat protein
MPLIENGNGKNQDLKKEVDLLLTMGNVSKALSIIDEAIKAAPSDWYLAYLMGWIHQSNSNAVEALRCFRRAEELAPDNYQLKARIGELLVTIGDIESALPNLKSNIETWPESSEAHSLFGIALTRKGDFDEAEVVLLKSCQLSESNPDARSGLIELYNLTFKAHLLKPHLEAYLQEAPDLASPHDFMANHIHLHEGNCEGACAFYEKALERYYQSKNPGWFRQYLSTCNYPDTIIDSYLDALLNCGHFDLIMEVSRNHLDAAQSRFWESIVYQRQGDVEHAIHSIQEAISDSPNNTSFRAKYAEYLLISGDPRAAENEIMAAIGDGPELHSIDPWYEGLLVASMIAQNRKDEADGYLHKVNSKNRDRVEASIIHNLAQLHQWSDVVSHCKKVLRTYANNSFALRFLAKAYRGLNQYSESIEIYNRLLKQQPDNGPVQIELGLVFEQAGYTEEGIHLFEDSLNGNNLSQPHKAEARRALKRLQTK